MNRFEVLSAALLAAALAAPAHAAVPQTIEEMESLAILAAPRTGSALQQESLARLWFVELKGAPEAEGGRTAAVAAEQGAVLAELAKNGIRVTPRDSYGKLFSGFSAAFTREQIARVRNMASVKAVWPVMAMSLDEDVDLGTAIPMTGADIVHNSLGLTGAGVKVAVMDTGVDYDHPDLGGCFGLNCRVNRGWDFVGDAYDSGTNPVVHPDPNPDDCQGHGTHVAGIIGANGSVVGVAPQAIINAYRVFGCTGGTDAAIMVKAMERVWMDRNDVLNMSIGAPLQWPGYPTAVAADRLVARGVIVTSSIGNSGDPTQTTYRGLFAAGAPGVGSKVIGVASVENTHMMFPKIDAVDTVTSTTVSGGYTVSSDAPAPPHDNSTMPLTRSGTQATTDDMCAAVAAGTFTGKAVLVRRGTCNFYWKAYNAMTAGASAVVLYNNAAGTLTPATNPATASPVGTAPITIPVIMLQQVDGNAIDTLIAGGNPVNVVWTDGFKQYANPSSSIMSTFSSLGPANDMSFKPDLAAPGGNIFSTYPLELGGYQNLSGTSMAAPHTAGAVALMLQKVPHQPQREVLRRLQNTADWVKFGLTGAASTRPAPVNRQGAGLIDIDDAILTKVNVYPGKIELGEFETDAVVKTVPVRIANSGPNDTFTVTYRWAYETYGSNFAPSTVYAGCTNVLIEGGTSAVVSVPKGTSGIVNVSFSTFAGCYPFNLIMGGFLEINGALGTRRTVPWMGYAGDMQRESMPTSGSLAPGLFRWNGASYAAVTGAETWTLADESNIPTFFAHFNEPTPQFSIQVKKLGTLAWRNAVVEKWMQRNNSSAGQFGWEWNGSIVGAKYPAVDGTYDVQVCAVKRLAKPGVAIATGFPTQQCIALPQIILDRP